MKCKEAYSAESYHTEKNEGTFGNNLGVVQYQLQYSHQFCTLGSHTTEG